MSLRTNSNSLSLDPSSVRCSSGDRTQRRANAPDPDNQQMVASRNLLDHIRVNQRMKRVVSKTFRSGNAELLKHGKSANGSKEGTTIRMIKIGVVGRSRFAGQQRTGNLIGN